MRKSILPLLLCVSLLWGCTPGSAPEENTSAAENTEATFSVPDGFYDPDSLIEQATGGAVRCYPLIGLECTGVMPLQDNLLVFSCTESSTTLTLLSGETLCPTASMELDMVLTSSNYSLRIVAEGLSFYDESTGETVVLDEMLRQVRRIPAPEGLCGIPLLSTDCSTLYYCTANSVRALDLESGISRCLKEMAYSFQYTKGLWLNDSVLECYISSGSSGQILFLSTETGQLLGSAGESFSFRASDGHYYATVLDGSKRQFLFGSMEEAVKALTPREEPLDVVFLPESHGAVTISMDKDSQLCLEHYDLNTGFRNSRLQLTTEYFPWDFHTTADGQIGFLNYDESHGCNVLYRWDINATLTGDDAIYTDTYYNREAPDLEGLAECALYAQQIGEKYGIEVLIYKDAAAVQPWDYDLEYEHLTGVLRRELELLDEHLSNYPEGFLATLAGRFDGLKICILRSLTGSAESGSLDSADGIQFMDGYTAYIALAADKDMEKALYHELCHLIDTVVITESGAYDRWEELNPSGFQYDYDYVANASRNSSAYLQDGSRYFIDNYSMSFPKEDRARIMEYAMTEGNEAYFQSATMQAKLKLLCEGIREAFGLKKSPETFLWEQYLNVSLTYKE